MSVRIAALQDELCPKCCAENIGRKVYVWRVADERGPHFECDVCAHSWQTENQVRFSDAIKRGDFPG